MALKSIYDNTTDSEYKSRKGRWQNNEMIIVGINLLILISYTIYFRLRSKDLEALIIDAFAIALHVVICLIVAAAVKRGRIWALSAGLILVIGFATCFSGLH